MAKGQIRSLRVVGLALALAGLLAVPARAEEPIPTDLDVSAISEEYIGTWILGLDLMGREMELFLTIADVEGKVGATLDSARSPEPLAITHIAESETGEGLAMASELRLGDFALDVEIDAQIEEGKLVGQIREASSELFKADFRGTKHVGDDDLVQGKRPSPTEARFRLPDGKLVRVTFGNIETAHEDFKGLGKLEPGDVFTYTSSRATKIYTDADLKFGETVIETENAAPNYPGVYSLWLKKTDDGWNLVFNEEADTWGTRYNPEATVAEVPLTFSKTDEEQEEFLIKIDQDAPDKGLLRVSWGTNEWTVPFVVSQ